MTMLLSCGWVASAMPAGFDAYQVIIDKHPFGEEPLEKEPAAVDPGQTFARYLRVSMMYEGPGGDVRVGIVDTQNKTSYVLKVGETKDGIELASADMGSLEARLKMGGTEVPLTLQEGSPAKVQQGAPARQNNRPSTFEERRQALIQRIQQQNQQSEPPPQPALSGEALRKRYEEVQMNAIREGLPPLPMQLTPEMDAQLVSEGVLDP